MGCGPHREGGTTRPPRSPHRFSSLSGDPELPPRRKPLSCKRLRMAAWNAPALCGIPILAALPDAGLAPDARLTALTIAGAFAFGMILTLLGAIKLALAKRLGLSEVAVGGLLSA